MSNLMALASVISYDAGVIIKFILLVLIALTSLFLIFVVIFQPGGSSGLGSLTGETETYYSKNKSKNLDGIFKKLTVISVILLVVFMVLFFVVTKLYAAA